MFSPVESSTISEVFYDLDAKTEIGVLYLRFKGKNPCIYRYAEVPKALVLQFMDAESKGKFVAQFIKGKFTTTQLPVDMMLGATAVDTEEQYDEHGLPIEKNKVQKVHTLTAEEMPAPVHTCIDCHKAKKKCTHIPFPIRTGTIDL